MADIDDLFTSPNAGAYEKEELRKGPPLTYVGEKVRIALYHVHSLCRSVREIASDTSPAGGPPASHSSGHDFSELIGRADAAFYYALVSFLALYNSLGRLGEWEEQEQKLQALRELSRESFDDWLDSIESDGSVTG
jgi:hypothetical protein